METQHKPWYIEKSKMILTEIIGGIFSLAFIKATCSSFSVLYGENELTTKDRIEYIQELRLEMQTTFI